MKINEETIDHIFNKELVLSELIENYGLLFATVDNKEHFSKLNIYWEKVLGYTIEELTEKPFTSFIHPKDLSKTLKAYQNTEEFQKEIFGTKKFTNRYKTKSGSYAIIDWFNTIDAKNKEIISIAIFRKYE